MAKGAGYNAASGRFEESFRERCALDFWRFSDAPLRMVISQRGCCDRSSSDERRHLGNIAHKTRKKLIWDAVKVDFQGEAEAARLLGRRARKPWDFI